MFMEALFIKPKIANNPNVLGWMDKQILVHPYNGTYSSIKKNKLGLPWWHSGWESACQCRGHGFAPWSGRIPHAAEQLGPWATTTEPARLELVPGNKRGRGSERPAHCDEEWPPLAATRKSPRTEIKTQHSQKLKKKKEKTIYIRNKQNCSQGRALCLVKISLKSNSI